MQKDQIYKCNVCGNIVELTHVGVGVLTCCDKAMIAMPELNHDTGEEKHVPIVTITETEIKVHLSSVDHPMEESHYIEWIELIADGEVYRKYLSPTDAPEAIFPVIAKEIKARAYCNLHGLRTS